MTALRYALWTLTALGCFVVALMPPPTLAALNAAQPMPGAAPAPEPEFVTIDQLFVFADEYSAILGAPIIWTFGTDPDVRGAWLLTFESPATEGVLTYRIIGDCAVEQWIDPA